MTTSADRPKLLFESKLVPGFNPAHLLAMTDDTGMLQHCRYSVPDRRHGYTLDDNVRALLVAAQSKDPLVMAQLPVYLSFVLYCQRPDGLFVNFVGYDRRFLEKLGSPDSHSRTLWALGRLYQEKPTYRPLIEPLIGALRQYILTLTSPRTLAFALLGLNNLAQASPGNNTAQVEVTNLAGRLVACWERNQQPHWHWFEQNLTYENARLPQALFAAYQITGQPRFLEIAHQATDFLTELHFDKGYLKLIGNVGWLERGRAPARFDEQPVDAGALTEMYGLAYETTGKPAYSDLAFRSLGWYKGENCHRLALYDPLTGGCYDGLQTQGVNYNQGAESVLSYALAQQSVLKIAGPDSPAN